MGEVLIRGIGAKDGCGSVSRGRGGDVDTDVVADVEAVDRSCEVLEVAMITVQKRQTDHSRSRMKAIGAIIAGD